MATRQLPSPEELRQLLRYEPETGKLFWLPRPREMFATQRGYRTWNAQNPGNEAFTSKNANGYYHGSLLGRYVLAHRVIWALINGEWPGGFLDHANGDRTNNRIDNLRIATPSQNSANQKIGTNNTSGHKGVSWINDKGKWRACITFNHSHHHLGYFDEIEQAADAYRVAAERIHGEYARD